MGLWRGRSKLSAQQQDHLHRRCEMGDKKGKKNKDKDKKQKKEKKEKKIK
jgi:hypothetical protein